MQKKEMKIRKADADKGRIQMQLRELKQTDAPLMYEWMHDKKVVSELKTDFESKTMEDCLAFISNAGDSEEMCHFAIADEAGEYMGTVSLKHIGNGSAEFAIAIRQCAMGKGYSVFAMKEIIRYGFDTLGLRTIYWCVAPENKRALRFYDKNGFERCVLRDIPAKVDYSEEEAGRYIWYSAVRGR